MRRSFVFCAFVLLGCSSGDQGTVGALDPGSGDEAGPPEIEAGPADTVEVPDEVGPDACTSDVVAQPGVVVTTSGAVAGEVAGETRAFRGIPFAAPPLGELRWRPPEPPACWPGVREAKAFGPPCPQIEPKSGLPEGSEDCLYLNVWTPEDAGTGAALPVLFFIHGGGNIQGSTSETMVGGSPIYDGRRLAERGAVVVTANYRLGPLGFLALPELEAESERGVSGNYGILDQLMALEWVHDNIAAFGGDPGRVMVFGESAGAVDTCTLLASPLAAGLFQAALMESGGCVQAPAAKARDALSARVDAESSCGGEADRLACLRAQSAGDLLAELPGSIKIGSLSLAPDPAHYGPIVDGWLLPETPLLALEAGHHNHVPFVIGTNAEELARLLAVNVATEAGYEATVGAIFSAFGQDVVDAVLTAYPAAAFPTPQDALVAILSDLRFTCPARLIARAAGRGQTEPVYRYLFSRRAPTAQGENPAAHGVELLYVFGTYDDIPLYQPAAEDIALSAEIMGYWSRLAAEGTPNGAGAVEWPRYAEETDPYLALDAPITAGEGVAAARCDLWEELLGL